MKCNSMEYELLKFLQENPCKTKTYILRGFQRRRNVNKKSLPLARLEQQKFISANSAGQYTVTEKAIILLEEQDRRRS